MSRAVYASNDLISLVEYQPCDDRALYDCWLDPETKKGYNGYAPAASFEEFQQGNQKRLEDYMNGETEELFFAMIRCNRTGELVGALGISPPPTEPDLSIRIFAPYRRRGYGTSAFALAAKYTTEALRIKELHAGAYPDNIGSQKMLRRSGFAPAAECPPEKHYLTGEDVIQMDYIYRPVHTVRIPLGERAYDVHIGPGLLGQAGALIARKLRPTRVLLVTDSNVAKYGYTALVCQSVEVQGIACSTFVFQAGEASKSLYAYRKILEACIAFGLYSNDALIALGGGVTGDLTGFAAATYRRGVPFVQVPTTLLAAVDSSVGGKTGVNLAAGKNLVGAFWQPGLVITDTDTFDTLPPEEAANGMAECLKHGLLFDEALFASLENGGAVSAAQVARNIELKRSLVLADEHDTGERRLLNLGHTLGHAIEQVSGYEIPHGAAVGLGMAMMARAFCPAIVDRLCAALEKNHLPTQCEYSIQELFAALERDKKRAGENITIVVPLEIGRCELRTMPVNELKSLLEERL